MTLAVERPPTHLQAPDRHADRRGWIEHWDPEDEQFWATTGARVARRNLYFSVFAEHIGFAVWTMWSTLVLFLGPEYGLDPAQKFTLVSVPAAFGGALRIPYTFVVAKFGGRNWTVISALLLLIPTVATAILLRPGVDYSTLLVLAAIGGVGGGNFASSMVNINIFYPERHKGWALGLNAAGGNLGVAVVQLLGLAVLATAGAAHPRLVVLVLIPVIVASALGSWFYMDNIVSASNEKRAMREACREPHTWIISLLYIGTFGSFIGFGFAFGQVLLVQFPEQFSHVITVDGVAKTVPDPRKAAYLTFLGPLIGSLARPLGGKIADRVGGPLITVWSFVALTCCTLLMLVASRANSLPLFLLAFSSVFIFSGLGNGSTYKMIPVLFRRRADEAMAAGTPPAEANARARRRTGAVIGIAGAIGSFGGLLVNIAFRESFLNSGNANAAYVSFTVVYVLCALLTWTVYLNPRSRAARPTPATSAATSTAISTATSTVAAADAAGPTPTHIPAQASAGISPVTVGAVHGQVIISGRGAADRATVTLIDPYGRQSGWALTTSGGRFTLTGLTPGRYLMVCGAAACSSVAVLLDIEAGPAVAHTVVLHATDFPTPVQAVCEVTGVVRVAGNPVTGALVALLDGNGAVLTTGYTDVTGRYRVDAAGGGSVTITAVAPGLYPTASALHLHPGPRRHDVDLLG